MNIEDLMGRVYSNTLAMTMTEVPRDIVLSKARRAKYFLKGEPMSLKYFLPLTNTNLDYIKRGALDKEGIDNKGYTRTLKDNYIWKAHELSTKKIENRLWDINKQEFVIKNTRTAGTPRIERINGQAIYSQHYSKFTRNKVEAELLAYFKSKLSYIFNTDTMKAHARAMFPLIGEGAHVYPLILICQFDFEMKDTQDLGNLAMPYLKALEDSLHQLNIIPDDNRNIIGSRWYWHNPSDNSNTLKFMLCPFNLISKLLL